MDDFVLYYEEHNYMYRVMLIILVTFNMEPPCFFISFARN